MKILFLDIDGVVLPGRAYMLPNQTTPIVKTFDPCAVSMINSACQKQGRQIVIHSSWIRTGFWKIGDDGPGTVRDHCESQGILPELFHPDWSCNPDISWRYDRIQQWLSEHTLVNDYVIVDDDPIDNWDSPHRDAMKKHLLLTDFEEGLTMKIYRRLLDGVFPVCQTS